MITGLKRDFQELDDFEVESAVERVSFGNWWRSDWSERAAWKIIAVPQGW